MTGGSADADLLNQLDALHRVGAVGDLSDGQLLRRFLTARGGASQAAFAALVGRHGPMVLHVCRHALDDEHDALDAFQATFLVLARKAGSVRKAESVASWLHGVALRVSARARSDAARRRAFERRGATMKAARLQSEEGRPESWPELHEEIGRLPERYREPVVLCYLEGLTTEAAALRIGCPPGTVLSRLSRARERLRARLARRGLSSPAALLAAVPAPETSSGVPAALIDATARAALGFAVRQATGAASASTGPVALARGVLHAMTISKLKLLAAAGLAGVIALGGLHAFARQFGGAGERDGGRKSVTPPARPAAVDSGGLPGQKLSTFGGGPGEPLYIRRGEIFFVISPVGDEFTVYDAATNRVSTIRLPGSKESPLKVDPVLIKRHLSLRLKGSRVDRLYLFSVKDWAWYTQELKEPVDGMVAGDVFAQIGGVGFAREDCFVAAYGHGRYVYAFSFEARRWAVLELPEGVTSFLSISPDSATVEYDGHVDQFSGETGEWEHTDFRALIDAAVKASRGDAEGEPGPPK